MVSCKHCGQPSLDKSDFCCKGCQTAWSIIHDLGLDNYYNTRTLDTNTTPLVPDSDLQSINAESFIVTDRSSTPTTHTLYLMVQGIHCAACVWLIEHILQQQDHVIHARVNMSTRRLTLTWTGDIDEGNRLAHLVSQLGYRLIPFSQEIIDAEQNQEVKFLLWCLAIAGFAAGNIMLLSVGLWTTTEEIMGVATRSFLHWVSALIALPAILFAGRPFFRSAFSVLRHRRTNMDVPISIGLILTCLMSLSETIQGGEHAYFDSATMLLFFLLSGRYLDLRARSRAQSAAAGLLRLMAGSATIINDDGTHKTVPLSEICPGDRLLVATGDKIPADGQVLEGISDIDTSLITGESIPKNVTAGSDVFAGTINQSAPLIITAKNVGEHSLLAEIIRLMEQATQRKSEYVRLADHAAILYTPVVHTLALIAFIGWVWIGGMDWQPALLIAVTVLIITCPCALGLAVPAVQVIASSRLLRQGILLKSGDALERLALVDNIVLDKTGTITLGHPKLCGGNYTTEDLYHAASLAQYSRHPLSQSLVQACDDTLPPIINNKVNEIPGCGLESKDCDMRLGKRSWIDPNTHNMNDSSINDSTTIALYFHQKGKETVEFLFQDFLRDDAKNVISDLKRNFTVTLLSGDNNITVSAVAKQAGISHFYGEQSPTDKCHFIEKLQQDGHNVLMVGDGLNDAPSLSAASVSISPSSAIDIAQNKADIIFQGRELAALSEIIHVANNSRNLIQQNLALATLYNIIAIPLAMAGYVTPLVAALAMSGSSLVVIGNAMRLNWKHRNINL